MHGVERGSEVRGDNGRTVGCGDVSGCDECVEGTRASELEGDCEYKRDPRIVGGMTVGIGEKYLDLSLLSKIKKVEHLIANPV